MDAKEISQRVTSSSELRLSSYAENRDHICRPISIQEKIKHDSYLGVGSSSTFNWNALCLEVGEYWKRVPVYQMDHQASSLGEEQQKPGHRSRTEQRLDKLLPQQFRDQQVVLDNVALRLALPKQLTACAEDLFYRLASSKSNQSVSVLTLARVHLITFTQACSGNKEERLLRLNPAACILLDQRALAMLVFEALPGRCHPLHKTLQGSPKIWHGALPLISTNSPDSGIQSYPREFPMSLSVPLHPVKHLQLNLSKVQGPLPYQPASTVGCRSIIRTQLCLIIESTKNGSLPWNWSYTHASGSRYIVPPAGLDTISRNQVTRGSRRKEKSKEKASAKQQTSCRQQELKTLITQK
ncbi:hypothetical protein Tco_0991124 [Tanacetum coccineum]|uniref:Uncharacterized protein n=1 Tax=Tanacetum coccineum TaxID=301880 RepID=A0ABQ5EZJ7_9ASTR